MTTNETQNGCESSIEAVLTSNQKRRRDYQKAYPDSGEIIHRMIDEEEAKAREISFFPHLILPDLVDARIGKLGLQPAETRHDTAALSHDFTTTEMPETAFALCG